MNHRECLTRPVRRIAGVSAEVARDSVLLDNELKVTEEIITAYHRAVGHELGDGNSFWLKEIAGYKGNIHDTFMAGDFIKASNILRYPRENNLAYGFDDLTAGRPDSEEVRDWYRIWTYDCFLRMCEALGAYKIECPEFPDERKNPPPDIEVLLPALDEICGFRIEFPNPFRGEIGLKTSRGVAGYRSIQALFQALTIFGHVDKNPDARVLEIGAGFARTAYYLKKLGLKRYTIIDLPMTNAAQSSMIARTLGPDSLHVYGGQPGDGKVSILPPVAFFGQPEQYDLIVNIDSMTEMSKVTAQEYYDEIVLRSRVFLSINHEANDFAVRDIIMSRGRASYHRQPYWLRAGYVEELVRF